MRILICAVILSLAAVCPAANRPNVLFVAIDDLRPDLGSYGAGFVKTPNLDRLAASGVTFRRAYCQQAVCSPSRTSLMTGKRPDTTRVYDLETHFRDTIPDTVTLPELFKKNGYHTVGMGKIYHGGLDDAQSWSEPHRRPKSVKGYALPANQKAIAEARAAGRERGLKGRALSRASRGPATELVDVPDDVYHDGALAEMAVDALRKRAADDKPFFLAVGFVKPHLPFVAPKKYWDLYERSQFDLPENYRRPPKNAPPFAGTNWGELRAYSDIPRGDDLLDEEKARELIHGYYAAVSYMDAQFGKVLDELERLDLSDETIVVVWGDHGWKLGEYGMWCKHTNFELDTHVPLIVRAPGYEAGASSKALVEFVDLYPTLCDLAGLQAPEDLEGTSFRPLLRRPDRSWKAAAFSQYPRAVRRKRLMGYSLATERYRFTRWVERKNPATIVAQELYDHETDPAENVNVAEDPSYEETVAKLSALADKGWKGVRADLSE